MANYSTLKTSVINVIKTNGNNEITGALLQQTLLAMINSLGADYQFVGIATPATNPGTPDQNVFYIAGSGTYPNFGPDTIPVGHIGVFKYNGSWDVQTVAVGKNYDLEISHLASFWSDQIFTEAGFYQASNGEFLPHASWRSTKKIPLQGKEITGYFYLPTSATNGAAIFWDENGNFISPYYISGGTIGQNTIPTSAFPNNAKYITIATLTTYLNSSYINYGNQPAFVLYDMANDNTAKSIATLSGQLTPRIVTVEKITDRFKTFGKELFCVSGYYDVRNGNRVSSNAVTTTPILQIYGDIWAHTYFGATTYPQYGICYFDENKNFISGSAGTTAGVQDVHIPVSNMPNGAKYFAISTLNTALADATLVCAWNGPVYDLSLKVISLADLPDRVTNVENQLIYSDGLQGLKFNTTEEHQLAKQAIKAIWLTYGAAPSAEKSLVDALRASLANTKFYITYLYNVSGQYGCTIRVGSASGGGDTCFTKYVAGIHTITGDEEVWAISAQSNSPVWPSGSGISGYPFTLYVAIDWNLLNNKTITTAGSNSIELTFGELHWGNRVDTLTLKDKVTQIDNQQQAIASIDLSGKKIVCFGDSITEMVVGGKHYSDIISDRTGATTINIGIGGTQLRQRREMAVDFDALPESTEAEIEEKSRYAYATVDIINFVKAVVTNNFTEQVKAMNWLAAKGIDDNVGILNRAMAIDWTTVDGVTVFAGTNEWLTNYPTLGESGSTDVNYTLGAVNEIIRLLLSTFKQLKLYWFTPIVRWIDYAGGTGTDANWCDVKSLSNGNLRVFSQAIMNEVQLNHIPCCDLYNNLGINKANFSNYFPDNDGTHPRTTAGVNILGKEIGAFILSHNRL